MPSGPSMSFSSKALRANLLIFHFGVMSNLGHLGSILEDHLGSGVAAKCNRKSTEFNGKSIECNGNSMGFDRKSIEFNRKSLNSIENH